MVYWIFALFLPATWVVFPAASNLRAGNFVVLVAGASAFVPWIQGFRRSRGLPLRGAVVWGGLALVCAVGVASTGIDRPGSMGRMAYLMALCSLAGLISVLNARNPGSGAWALLMGLLVLVFLIPWLEGIGLAGGVVAPRRLRLEMPWSLFYGLLVVAGVTNFLPTRFGGAAMLVGLSLILVLGGLVVADLSPQSREQCWRIGAWFVAMAMWGAWRSSRSQRDAADRFTTRWLWFRDFWGVVWGLRVMERFNRTAEAAGWGFQLTWQGPVDGQGNRPEIIPEVAVQTLDGLLRRFVSPTQWPDSSRNS